MSTDSGDQSPTQSVTDVPTELTAQRLLGRVAVVTGGASGIGLATVKLCARHGARVLAVDLPQSELHQRVGGLENVEPLALDITEADAAETIVSTALREFEGIDIVVNNAGVSDRVADFTQVSDDSWSRIMDVNINAMFKICRAVTPKLRESEFGGRIVNIASVMAHFADHGLAAYCASKAAVAGLTRSLALDLGRDGITANYIMPGAIHTGMTDRGFVQPEIAEVWAKKSALKRLGQPIDIAKAILFLVSDDGAFVNGQGLSVCGGITLRT